MKIDKEEVGIIVSAIFQTVSIFLASMGFVFATYLLIALLSLTIGLYLFIASTNSVEIEGMRKTKIFYHKIVLQMIFFASLYSVYSAGYEFFAGVALIPLMIGTIYIFKEGEPKK